MVNPYNGIERSSGLSTPSTMRLTSPNPYNGIERHRHSAQLHIWLQVYENPYNGIERPYWFRGGKRWLELNPYNGIERLYQAEVPSAREREESIQWN